MHIDSSVSWAGNEESSTKERNTWQICLFCETPMWRMHIVVYMGSSPHTPWIKPEILGTIYILRANSAKSTWTIMASLEFSLWPQENQRPFWTRFKENRIWSFDVISKLKMMKINIRRQKEILKKIITRVTMRIVTLATEQSLFNPIVLL